MVSQFAVVLALSPILADAHGAMVSPRPRQSLVDGDLPFFRNGGCALSEGNSFCYSCACGNVTVATDPETGAKGMGTGCNAGIRSNMGQSCLWFSQGCTIGCNVCDNATQHTMGNSTCGKPPMKPTLPRYAWTMNRWVTEEGSANDTYSQHPWRAPGHAPLVDSCGMAGGSPTRAGGAAIFSDQPKVKQGDLAADVLSKGPAQATWSAGGTAEVSWGIRANHGGGYQYRLCPASQPLTEACFSRTPLEFVGQSRLQYVDGSFGPWFNRTEVREGVKPEGSVWAMNPIPRIDFDSKSSGQPRGWDACKSIPSSHSTSQPTSPACRQFESPACNETDPTTDTPWHPIPGAPIPSGDVEGKCSGDFISAVVVDKVRVPSGIQGEFVLQMRWDCEETAQIWTSCADIIVVQ